MELGVKYILEAGVKTESNIQISTRALIIYHNFMRYVGEAHYDPSTVAAASLHLSHKLGEKELDLNGLILLFYYMVNGTANTLYPGSMKFEVLKKSLLTVEYVMHRMLEFTLKFSIAHQFLVPFLNCLLHRAKRIDGFFESMSETCVKLMSDFYTDRMCLDYKPEDIAIACMDAALHFHGFIQHLNILHPWYEGFSIDLPEEKVQEMKRGLFRLYKNEGTERPSAPAGNTVRPSAPAGNTVRPSAPAGNTAGPSAPARNRARSSAPARKRSRPSASVRNRTRQSTQARDFVRPSAQARDTVRPSAQVEDILSSPEDNTI